MLRIAQIKNHLPFLPWIVSEQLDWYFFWKWKAPSSLQAMTNVDINLALLSDRLPVESVSENPKTVITLWYPNITMENYHIY